MMATLITGAVTLACSYATCWDSPSHGSPRGQHQGFPLYFSCQPLQLLIHSCTKQPSQGLTEQLVRPAVGVNGVFPSVVGESVGDAW